MSGPGDDCHLSHGDDDSNVGDHSTTAASSVVSALSNLDTGQPSFALFASSANVVVGTGDFGAQRHSRDLHGDCRGRGPR
jgi:hypothetical protein